jgi:hypothetical protein
VSLEQSKQLLHALGFLLRGFFLRGFGSLIHGVRPFPVCKGRETVALALASLVPYARTCPIAGGPNFLTG